MGDELKMCVALNKILSLDDSISWKDFNDLIKDRTKIATDTLAAYQMFDQLFASNDVDNEFYVTTLWYFYRTFYEFTMPTASNYRNKPEIFVNELDEATKQYKYKLANKFFNAHYLAEVGGVNLNVI